MISAKDLDVEIAVRRPISDEVRKAILTSHQFGSLLRLRRQMFVNFTPRLLFPRSASCKGALWFGLLAWETRRLRIAQDPIKIATHSPL